jgi:hypothetical protein
MTCDKTKESITTQFVVALTISIALAVFIGSFTNSITPQWDGTQYIQMARYGIIGNKHLVAPYAYRPGTPFLAHIASRVFSISVENAFRAIGWVSVVLFSVSVFTLSRHFAKNLTQALITVAIIGLSFQHIKYPLFFYSLVDVVAYPLIIISIWLLITERPLACLLVSSVGCLFKEFLAIPLLLVTLEFAAAFWKVRTTQNVARLLLAIAIGLSVILIPRVCIPVVSTYQFIDPINDVQSLKHIYLAPTDKWRWFNIVYSLIGYWLPSLLLLTTHRLNRMWSDLKELGLQATALIYLTLVLVLTLYGGSNIVLFVSYSVPIQVIILTLILRQGASAAECIYVLAAMLLFNKTLLPIPRPDLMAPGVTVSQAVNTFVDFYGGWSSRVNMSTVSRLFQAIALIGGATCIRHLSLNHGNKELVDVDGNHR